MEDETSRQELTDPASLLRRTQLWITGQFDVLVALVRSTLQSLKASHIISEDGILERIIKALENGLPIGALPTPEQPVGHSVREEYESRVGSMNAVYDDLVPEFERPSKPTPKEGVPMNDYEDQLSEYVLSSLRIALPQSPSERSRGAAFPPSPTQAPMKTVPSATTARSIKNGPPAETVPPVSDREPFEPGEVAAVVNYRKWKRELYTKSPLDQSSIRLVEILPGSPDDKVEITMGVYILDQVVMQYEGLSYVCGNPEPAKIISIITGTVPVKQEEVPVNPNLYDALISLQQSNSVRRVWIDAICINQMSMKEKSKEVQKMGPVYARAKTVMVFLGASHPGRPTSISAFLKFLNRDAGGHAADRSAEQGRVLKRICDRYQMDVQDVCKGFIDFSLQPWWSRVWTLQEFYLAKEDPISYWGSEHASNASLKRDFRLLMDSLRNSSISETTNGRALCDLRTNNPTRVGSFKVESKRISGLISRRYTTDGPDTPRRLYRELSAQAVNPRDFVYALRAIFDPIFARIFVPDYHMSTELLFACVTVFLIQFEGWGDVLWWYPTRYAGRDSPSSLPNLTHRNVPHELDVQSLVQAVNEKPEQKLVVHNHRLHAKGYILDTVCGHQHLDKSDGRQIFEELWQFDHCMNHNYEWNGYFAESPPSEEPWSSLLRKMYTNHYAGLTYSNPASRGQLLQSTMKPEEGNKLPQQVSECMPSWDLLRWHAIRATTPGLPEALGLDIDDSTPGYLQNVFSSRMEKVFMTTLADFFIGACMHNVQWTHLVRWLVEFPKKMPWRTWATKDDRYWTEIHDSLLGDTEKRAKAIAHAYRVYSAEIVAEAMSATWYDSRSHLGHGYTLLAYVILLDSDEYADLTRITCELRRAGLILRDIYFSITTAQIEKLPSEVPSVATRVSHYNTVLDLFSGRCLFWTNGGLRGITCPGVEPLVDRRYSNGHYSDGNSIVAIVDGLSFPVVVRDYDEATGEGSLAGCALIRGVDMLNRDSDRAVLPPDYERGEKRIFKFR